MRIISSVCKMHEIALEGVLLVEDISKARERFPCRDAIYLLSPSEESIEALIKDFQDSAKPAYRNIHVFFTEGTYVILNCLM
jgi:syntaxin-binding protein 1